MDLRPRAGLAPPNIRRVVVVMPSAFTLGNLFFGFWAIVSAANGSFRWAGWFVVFAGILDLLDGRVARLSRTSTRFGEELDSLIDVISFGVAPALLIYFLEFQSAGRFAWLLCFLYTSAVALRLARFNVLSAGKPSTGWFTGLPSPAAGVTLATYYPFSQTTWYKTSLAYLDLQHQGLVVLLLLLSVLLLSNVKYPKFPRVGVRDAGGIAGLVFVLAVLVGGLTVPEYMFFPLGITYMIYGLARAALFGMMERRDALHVSDDAVETPDDPADHSLRRERRQETME